MTAQCQPVREASPLAVTVGGVLVPDNGCGRGNGFLVNYELELISDSGTPSIERPEETSGSCVDAVQTLEPWLNTLGNRGGRFRWRMKPVNPVHSVALVHGHSAEAAVAFGWAALAENSWLLPCLSRIAITGTILDPNDEHWTARLGPVTHELKCKLEVFCGAEKHNYSLLVVPLDERLGHSDDFRQVIQQGWDCRLLVVRSLGELKEHLGRLLGREVLLSYASFRERHLWLFIVTQGALAILWALLATVLWVALPDLYFLPVLAGCILSMAAFVIFQIWRNESHYRQWEVKMSGNGKQKFDRKLLSEPAQPREASVGRSGTPSTEPQQTAYDHGLHVQKWEMLRKLTELSPLSLPRVFARWLEKHITHPTSDRLVDKLGNVTRWIPASMFAGVILLLTASSLWPEMLEGLPLGRPGKLAVQICPQKGSEHSCVSLSQVTQIPKAGYLRISVPRRIHTRRLVEVSCTQCLVYAGQLMSESAVVNVGVGGTVQVPYAVLHLKPNIPFQFEISLRARDKSLLDSVTATVQRDCHLDPWNCGAP
jgi:hypothetical protein